MAKPMEVFVEEYADDAFDEFMEAFTEASKMGFAIDDPLHVSIGHFALEDSKEVIRAIRRATDGEHLGYCEVHDVEEDTWELGIHILERHRGMGAGTAAMPLFLDELASTYDRHEFVARVEPDNEASLRLFSRLGERHDPEEAVNDGPGPFEQRLINESDGEIDPAALMVARQLDQEEARAARECVAFWVTWPEQDR